MKRALQIAMTAIIVQMMFSLTGCAQKEQKQFIQDFNSATSMEFNIPYIDKNRVLAGYDLEQSNAMEKQLRDTLLQQAVPKQQDGSYLMTNKTLIGALCNPSNALGYFINPTVTQPASTLTTDNIDTMNTAIQKYISGALVGKNLGEDTATQQLSQKYIVANIIFKILPARDYADSTINPNEATVTRAQAMVAIMRAFYGNETMPENTQKIDTQKIDNAIQTAVDNGLISKDQVPYRFLTENNKALAWMDQFSYLKISDSEMGANLLFKEITYGEFEYMLSNLMIYNGLIQEDDIVRQTESMDKKQTQGYIVKSLPEIVEKARKSTKMQSNVIPGKTLQLLRALYTDGVNKTVEPELYSVYNQMAQLGINKQNLGIYSTMTLDDIYSDIVNTANFIMGKGLDWVETQTDQSETQTDQSETQTDQSETQTDQSETQTDQSETSQAPQEVGETQGD